MNAAQQLNLPDGHVEVLRALADDPRSLTIEDFHVAPRGYLTLARYHVVLRYLTMQALALMTYDSDTQIYPYWEITDLGRTVLDQIDTGGAR